MTKERVLYIYSERVKMDGLEFLRMFSDRDESSIRYNGVFLSGAVIEQVVESNGKERFTKLKTAMDRILSKMVIYGEDIPPVFFAGFSFDGERAWENFPPAQFLLHRYNFRKDEDGTFLTVCRMSGNVVTEKDLRDELQRLKQRPAVNHGTKYSQIETSDVPEKEEWFRMMEQTKLLLSEGLKKIVISRSKIIRYEQGDHLRVFRNLISEYSENYCFMFKRADDIFLGATPELLARKKGLSFYTEALAGSAPRGRSNLEDEQNKQTLLLSEKEREEHDIVVEEIVRLAREFCNEIRVAPIGVRTLGYIHHLNTEIRGELMVGVELLDMVKTLHPTPALGGLPRDSAIKAISKIEKKKRGWYGSPIGWIDSKGDGEFYVGIRSALIRPEEIIVTTGAGIVEQSDPAGEWEETELKFSPIIKVLEKD